MMEDGVGLVCQFQRAWSPVAGGTAADVDFALSALLAATGARAVGWWRRNGERLQLLGFQAADDMPAEVQSGFRDATRDVPLTRVELGCVRAAAERQPVVAREDATIRGLTGSASWLARFGAAQSLAVPIVQEDQAVGVLAIATADVFEATASPWRLLQSIATVLSESR